MEKENIKEEYDKLLNVHDMPNFEDLDNEFEISTIDKKKFLLRNIRRKMLDKFDAIKLLLEDILQPDTNSFASMYETRTFNDGEKKKIYKIYKTLMIIERTANSLSLKSDGNQDAEFIQDTFDKWNKIRLELGEYVSKLKESWQKEASEEETVGYFG